MRNRFALAVCAVVTLSSLGLACHKEQSAAAAGPAQPPAGEAWLTPQQVKDAKIESQVVTEQDVSDTVTTSGRVTFDDLRVAHVFSPVTGRVTRIDAQLGQRVKKGQVLAVIQSPDLAGATSDLGKAEADLVAAQHDFKRKKDLFEAHAGSQADLEIAEDNLGKAKAEESRALQKKQLFNAGGGGDSVSSGYALTAAIDGEVIARTVNPGVEVQGQYSGGAAVELFTIGELDSVWVIADVYEQDLARVKVGEKAVVKVVAYPNRSFEGKVDWVSGMLDPTSRTAKIRCTFANPDRALKPEMYATAMISVEEQKGLAVPRSSVLRLGEQTVVFLQRGQTPDGRVRFERLPVTVDEAVGGNWLPVSHGIEKGETVVTAGAILLSGML